MESYRAPLGPYREPAPRPEDVCAVRTCEEMRRQAGALEALLFVVAVCTIAWSVVGR